MKLKIAVVSDHLCIRVYKENDLFLNKDWYLKNGRLNPGVVRNDYDMHLITCNLGTGYDRYKTVNAYCYGEQGHTPRPEMREQFGNAVRFIADTVKPDIWHIHNEPDWICEETIKIVKGEKKPGKIIWDIHDPESARNEVVPFGELEIMRSIDGLVYVSQEEKEWMEYIHPRVKDIPSAVIHSCYPLARIQPPRYAFRIPNTIVYEGGIAAPGEIQRLAKEPTETVSGKKVIKYNMRDYGNIIAALHHEGFKVHLYGSDVDIGDRNRFAQMYQELGAVTERSVSPLDLPSELCKYEFGIVGFPVEVKLFDMALPNKFYDYLCAGVIPVVFNAPAAGRLVKQHGLGVWWEDFRQAMKKGSLRQVLALSEVEKETMRRNIDRYVKTLYMEAQIGQLEDLYERLSGKNSSVCNADSRRGYGEKPQHPTRLSGANRKHGCKGSNPFRSVGIGKLSRKPGHKTRPALGGK